MYIAIRELRIKIMKYRIKEEYKHLFTKQFRDREDEIGYFEEYKISKEALEPIEERVELHISNEYGRRYLMNIGREWTEHDVKFLEFCLNDLKSEESLDELANQWLVNLYREPSLNLTFLEWMQKSK